MAIFLSFYLSRYFIQTFDDMLNSYIYRPNGIINRFLPYCFELCFVCKIILAYVGFCNQKRAGYSKEMQPHFCPLRSQSTDTPVPETAEKQVQILIYKIHTCLLSYHVSCQTKKIILFAAWFGPST